MHASFRILLPRNLPPGTSLVVINHHVLRGFEGRRGYDWVEVVYKTADGRELIVRQGDGDFLFLGKNTPADAFGEITIQGKRGFWVDGHPQTAAGQAFRIDGWSRGTWKIAWEPNPDPVVHRDGNVETVVPTTSDLSRQWVVFGSAADFRRDDLIAVAESAS